MRMSSRFSLMAVLSWLLALSPAMAAPPSPRKIPSKYPTKPIRLIVGFAAGGGNDIIARVFGQKLSESLGQPVIVDNKPGGGAIVATEYVAKSAPDGYTLLMSASGMSINPAVYAKLPYDAVNDFVAVSELGLVSADHDRQRHRRRSSRWPSSWPMRRPIRTRRITASSSASFQLVTELFKQKTGAPMQVIPYKSANESVLAVISGQVTTTIADAGPVSARSRAAPRARWRSPAPRRMDDLPDVPTLKEAGVDVDAVLWSGIFVPKATPPAIVRKLEGEFMRIARLPDVIARLKSLGIDTVGNSSQEFAKILADDIARWGEVARAAKIRIEQ